MNPLELPSERLATTDAKGWRVFLHPLETHGRFRTYRNFSEAILILFFLVLPWTSMNGIQTVLLDIPHRRFSFFGTTFWAHDAPIVFFLLSGLAFLLAFTATTYGRAWCGWACPQTVFIDGLFRKLETLVEGTSHARKALDKEALGFKKILKRGTKWILFLFLSLVIANSLLAYFVGAEPMLDMIGGAPERHWPEFVMTISATSILLFNFGWFREQFCVIMCPYGRLQSVLMDEASTVIKYDQKRGEPRKGSLPTDGGDCVNCFKCVAVCPTGIDIRRGTQLECIACAACVDACDEIMVKTNKPTGLIRYGRENEASSRFQAKNIVFALLICLIFSSFTYILMTRKSLSFEVLRARGSPFELRDSETLINHFHLEVNNHDPRRVSLRLEAANAEVVMPENPVFVNPGQTSRVDFFVQFPKTLLTDGHGQVQLRLLSNLGETEFSQEVPLVGPFQ